MKIYVSTDGLLYIERARFSGKSEYAGSGWYDITNYFTLQECLTIKNKLPELISKMEEINQKQKKDEIQKLKDQLKELENGV